MAKGFLEFDLIGDEDVLRRYKGIQERMLDVSPAWRRIEEILQEGERRHFTQLKGRFVDTGRVRASLVGESSDSIRHLTDEEYTFGTSVFYARFLKGANTKKSAVLVLKPKERKAARMTMMDHLLGRVGGIH